MIAKLDRGCHRLILTLLMAIWIGATWLFGAWDFWWFWPFAGLVFAAAGGLGLRMILNTPGSANPLAYSRLAARVAAAAAPFLLYAVVRAVQADVWMDAERSLLLHLTAFLIVIIVLLATTPQQQQRGTTIITVSLALIGLYGVINHFAFHNTHVLWMPGFAQYQSGHDRATGTYFCPDHFAGLMEIALGLGLATLLSRSASKGSRLAAGGLILLSLAAIVLSKSRGAGVVVPIMLAVALWLAPSPLPAARRWLWRIGALAALAAAIAGFILAGGSYVERFRAYPWRALEYSDRFQMSAAAFRGWQSAPLFGIGPGMHQNLWPHFAATADGDRAKGLWPSHLNNTYHSYEAHNDWVQLLEEYGAVGLALFLLATSTITGALLAARRRQVKRWRAAAPEVEPGADRLVLGILFALLAMAIHSVGDFNLQIPGTVWLMSGLAGMGLAAAARDVKAFRRRRQGLAAP
jgi:putative inorganic carbon (HCO3(-)) transporter